MKISASLLSSDLLNLEREIQDLSDAGVDALHIDIMDGHFVPNIAFGIDIVKKIANVSDLPISVHLMINNPERFIDLVSSKNIDYIIVHSEGNRDVVDLFDRIRANGIRVGLALNPQTQVSEIVEYLNMIDMALVMGVHPGFGGQTLISSTIEKIGQLKSAKQNLVIGVDGGINSETVQMVSNRRPDILVVGSYLFDNSTQGNKVENMKSKLQILRGN